MRYIRLFEELVAEKKSDWRLTGDKISKYKVGDYVTYSGNPNIFHVVKIDSVNKWDYRVCLFLFYDESMHFTWLEGYMIGGKASEEDIMEYKRIEDEIKLKDATNKYNL